MEPGSMLECPDTDLPDTDAEEADRLHSLRWEVGSRQRERGQRRWMCQAPLPSLEPCLGPALGPLPHLSLGTLVRITLGRRRIAHRCILS